jgi:hypothetical protein
VNIINMKSTKLLTYFISSNLLVEERINQPIFGMNDFDGSFDATMVHSENDISAYYIDEINVHYICGFEISYEFQWFK